MHPRSDEACSHLREPVDCRQGRQQNQSKKRERPPGGPPHSADDVTAHVSNVCGQQLYRCERAKDEREAVEELGQVQRHLVGVFGACGVGQSSGQGHSQQTSVVSDKLLLEERSCRGPGANEAASGGHLWRLQLRSEIR
jgi:hypothetical protein